MPTEDEIFDIYCETYGLKKKRNHLQGETYYESPIGTRLTREEIKSSQRFHGFADKLKEEPGEEFKDLEGRIMTFLKGSSRTPPQEENPHLTRGDIEAKEFLYIEGFERAAKHLSER